MKKVFAFGAAAERGDWPLMEDAFWIDPVVGVFVLADGFGGKGAGDYAAAQSVKCIGETIASSSDATKSEEAFVPFLSAEENFLRTAFLAANQILFATNEKKNFEDRGGACVITASFLPSGRTILGSLGNCGAVILRAGRAIPLLHPQSRARNHGEAVGSIHPKFGLDFPLAFLGIYPDVEPELRTYHFQGGDHLLLYTEGLLAGRSELLAQAALLTQAGASAGTSLEEGAKEILALAALAQRHKKNHSLILVRCN